MKKLLILFFPLIALGSPQGIPALSVTTVGTSNVLCLAANPYRGYLIIQNQGQGSCLISPASIVSPDGIMINGGQNYEMQQAFTKSAIYCQCSNAGNKFAFLETNF